MILPFIVKIALYKVKTDISVITLYLVEIELEDKIEFILSTKFIGKIAFLVKIVLV